MKAGRLVSRQIRSLICRDVTTKRMREVSDSMLLKKPSRLYLFGARTKTDTGRRVEHTKAIGRTMVKELGILTP